MDSRRTGKSSRGPSADVRAALSTTRAGDGFPARAYGSSLVHSPRRNSAIGPSSHQSIMKITHFELLWRQFASAPLPIRRSFMWPGSICRRSDVPSLSIDQLDFPRPDELGGGIMADLWPTTTRLTDRVSGCFESIKNFQLIEHLGRARFDGSDDHFVRSTALVTRRMVGTKQSLLIFRRRF